MNAFLIEFEYTLGKTKKSKTLLVYSSYFESACEKIIKLDKYKNAKHFENLTIE